MTAKFALVRGRDVVPIAEIKANGRRVSTMHELTHVVQQRGCQLTLSFDETGVSAAQKTIIGGFKSMSGMDSETEVVDQALVGERVALGGFKATGAGATPYFPGNTKYSSVKLTRS
ncbi:hypothetical protein HNQ60_005116 [Povalibacter uvarum]|uniref:Uncharacterized protein n=1 Tax=Povalibacter uvarum TaxID=732238 RepID=A0A841HU80_9GAMM|nr:hypothetical protein [Povalibacter uvarum]MBB6096194.1 hypothetical protein [Povalibacter uvarum]